MDEKNKQTTIRLENKKETKPVTFKELFFAVSRITLSCYGVSKLQAKYFFELNKKNIKLNDAIEITMRPNKTYHIKVYVSLAPHTKLTEVLSEIQKRIKYEIEKVYKIKIRKIDIFAQSIE